MFLKCNQVSDVTGNQRFLSDKRQIAGVLLAISITVCFFPLARLAPLINRDGNTATGGIELALLLGNLVALTLGLFGGTVAYMSLVHECSTPRWTGALLVLEQTALLPYISDIWAIGKAANTGAAFIPASYNPSKSDVWFVGACGMIGAATYCLFLFGGLSFLAIAHYAFQTGRPHNGQYYRNRLVFYSAVLSLAGVAQLMLGSYIIHNFGNGPLPAPIAVAMFPVHFPELSITVGFVQLWNGFYGMYRGMMMVKQHQHNKNKKNAYLFQIAMWVQQWCVLALQIVVQTTYAPGNAMAAAAPTIANLSLGLQLMPAFLDYKGRTVPDEFDPDYYGIIIEGDGADSMIVKALDENFEHDYDEEDLTAADAEHTV